MALTDFRSHVKFPRINFGDRAYPAIVASVFGKVVVVHLIHLTACGTIRDSTETLDRRTNIRLLV